MKNKRAKASIWITLILLLCLGTASTANAATLTIISVECLDTEDDDTDEALLKVTGEGITYSKQRKMWRDRPWQLNKRIFFRDELTVRLYDLDGGPFDPNDYLGGFIIRSTPTNGERMLIFNRDGANYHLFYRVDR